MVTETVDLNSMSVDELWSLHQEISEILSARILEEKRELEKRLAILNRGMGQPREATEPLVSQSKRPRRKYPKVLPQYRNPETSETWSGRGKRPRWLTDAMKAGHDMEAFRISLPDEAEVASHVESGAVADERA